MLIPNPNGDGAEFQRRGMVLDALGQALQAGAFMSDSEQTLERLREAVAGRYRVVGELGRGSMGVVYLAYDLALERGVAMKLLAPALAAKREERERFLREARTAARLAHPNIVPIHAVERGDEFVFFTMDYVEGATLGDWVRSRGPVPVGEATWMLHDVARAVGYAHARGVIHRDLKPDNIIIDGESGRPMVMDFGIAHVQAEPDIEREDYVLGTAPFISPERVTGGHGDERSDVYALGVTAYFAVTGRHPFDGETAQEIFRQHVWTPAPTLHLHSEHLDLTFSNAVGRCLEKDPARRFQDGDELADALSKAPEIRGRELPVPLEAFVARMRRLSASSRGLSVLVAAALIVVLDRALHGDLAGAAWATGFLGLVAAGGATALLPFTRRLLREGYSRADLVHALSVDLERDREVTQFEHGSVSPTPARVARWLAYGGLGLAGVAAVSSLVPILDPLVGLAAMGTGVVLAFGGAIFGLFFGRRLSRPGRLWLRFWRSRVGEWAVRLAGLGVERELPAAGRVREIGAEETALDDVEPDGAAVRRIREWLEEE